MTLPQAHNLRRNGDEVVIDLILPADHAAFLGHFPSRPVVPGVLQIDWAMQFASHYFDLDQTVAIDFQVKFRRLIEAGDDLALTLRLDGQRRTVAFEYRTSQEIASTGKIKLEPGA
jgi:3-hydroxymyristoyl/3-hydroxydecanoyl-(acyl carrier protein) dehydratase